MEHTNYPVDDVQALWRNFEPRIKGVDQLSPYVLARVLRHVVIWTHKDFLILRIPHAIFVLGTIHAGPVAGMSARNVCVGLKFAAVGMSLVGLRKGFQVELRDSPISVSVRHFG